MFLEKKGSVLIRPAAGSTVTKAVVLACDKITNVRIVRVDPVVPYLTRYGQEGTAQTIIAEDLDIPGHNHRITAYKENIAKFGPMLVEGSIIEVQGLRTKGFGFNLLDVKVLKAAPSVPVAVVAPAIAAPAAEVQTELPAE